MASLEVPATQSTAPVLEYRCLFTADLRRKQKRWQDGQLKFHTFNKRIMVYDDRSNFVGDSHWRGDQLEEGEELELERRGILVEVGEQTGQRNQDVSELVDKRRKDKEDRAAARVAASPAHGNHKNLSTAESLPPKLLNQILSPSGHYGGAAVPVTSPFEEGQQRTSLPTDKDERPAKRRKHEGDTSSRKGYAQNLLGASLSLSSSRPTSTPSITYRPLKLQSTPLRKEATVDLTEDSNNDEVRLQSAIAASKDCSVSGPTTASRQKLLSLSYQSQSASRGTSNFQTVQHGSSSGNDATVTNPGQNQRGDGRKALAVSKRSTEPAVLKGLFESRSSSPYEDLLKTFIAPNRASIISTDGVRSSPKAQKRPTYEDHLSNMTAELPSPVHVAERKKYPEQTATPRQDSNLNLSAHKTTSAKSTSSLRIKSRPPKKMMMLMDRSMPHGKQMAKDDSSSRPKGVPKVVAQDLILSQATLQLDAFREKQAERLQARLEGQRAMIGSDEVSNSPPDSGINHQTIDLLLSRKAIQREVGEYDIDRNRAAESADGTKDVRQHLGSNEESGQKATSSPKISQRHEQNHAAFTATESLDVCSTPFPDNFENDATGKPASAAALPGDDLQDSEFQGPGPLLSSRINVFQSNSKNAAFDMAVIQPKSFREFENEESPNLWLNAPQIRSGAEKLDVPTTKTSAENALLESNSVISYTKPSVSIEAHRDTNVTMQGAVEHFGNPPHTVTGIRSQSVEHSEDVSGLPSIAQEPNLTTLIPLRIERVSSLMTKNSHNTAHVELPVMQVKLSPRSNPNPLIAGQILTPLLQAPTSMAPENNGNPPPIVRLANPATRGKSLHSIATTTSDIAAPASNLIAALRPPHAGPLNRSNKANHPDENARQKDSVREESTGGPWSRESFDLFGAWKPPDGNAGTNVAAA